MRKIGIVMGSDSDLPILEKAMDTLRELQIPFEVHVYSAHRTPDQAISFAKSAREKGSLKWSLLTGIQGPLQIPSS